MRKTVDIVFKAMPTKKLVASREHEQFLVYLGEDYSQGVSKARACGLFLGSKDKVTGEIDVDHGVPRSKMAIGVLEGIPGDVVLYVDEKGYFLMERAIAMEMAGLLDSV